MEPLRSVAQGLAGLGRYGDSELLHVNPIEVRGIEALIGRELPTNPYTGSKEAFFFLPFLFGPAAAGAAATGIGAAATTALTSTLPGIGAGIGAGLSGLMSGLGPAAASVGTGLGTAAGELGAGLGAVGTGIKTGLGTAAGELGASLGTGLGSAAGELGAIGPAAMQQLAAETAGGFGGGFGGGGLQGLAGLSPEMTTVTQSLPAGQFGYETGAALAPEAGSIQSLGSAAQQAELAGPAGQIGTAAQNQLANAIPGYKPVPVDNPLLQGQMLDPQNYTGYTDPAGSELYQNAVNAPPPEGGGILDSLGQMDFSSLGQMLAALGAMGGGGGKGDGGSGEEPDGEYSGPTEYDYRGREEYEYYPRYANNGGLIRGYAMGGPVGQEQMVPVMQPAPGPGGGLQSLMNPPMMGGGDIMDSMPPATQIGSPYGEEKGSKPDVNDEDLVVAAVDVLTGNIEGPEADAILMEFVDRFGEEALMDLSRRAQMVSGGAQGENAGALAGPGDGMSDGIPSLIDGKEPAALSSGEFVVPADAVAHLGNGDTGSGGQRLQSMVDNVRAMKTGNPAQPPYVDPNEVMPV